MSEMRETCGGIVDPAQAANLAVLVELEARWENLKKARSRDLQARSTLQDLQSKQKAYEAFRSNLVAYNKQYKPAHVPELLLNTPARLGTWCRSMRNLYLQVETDTRGHSPVHLLEKAYRWADMLGMRLNKPLVNRSTAPGDTRAVIKELEALGHWCDDLASGAVPPALLTPSNLRLTAV